MKVSVIMPVYQAENYLDRCIKSVLVQTLKDFELIIIDDGSTDNSSSICDKYAILDKRIKVFHQDNKGVSVARQVGLDNATGEYVIYVDPDDWQEPTFLFDLYSEAKRGNYDLVLCDYYAEYNGKTKIFDEKPTNLDSRSIIEDFFPRLHGSTWNKLVRRDCFEKYHVKFPTGIQFCEDLYVNCKLLLNNLSVGYVNKPLYHYDQVVNPNSLVRSYSKDTYKKDMRVWELFVELFKSNEPQRFRSVMSRNLTERAFYANVFSNREFKKNFGIFRRYLVQEKKNFTGKLYYYSACGYYRVAFIIYRLYLIAKKIVKSVYSFLFGKKLLE